MPFLVICGMPHNSSWYQSGPSLQALTSLKEIHRHTNGKEDMNIDDEISKSFETIVHLKTQIEEAKRIEELLKIQINEKEDSCCMLKSQIVDLRKKDGKVKQILE